MVKEGKVDILSVLFASILIFVVYAVLVFGRAAVISHFPENATNVSSTAGSAAESVSPMGRFNGTNALFKCNITFENLNEFNISKDRKSVV